MNLLLKTTHQPKNGSLTSGSEEATNLAKIIGFSLSHEHLEHVHGIKTTKGMWKTIMGIFERHAFLEQATHLVVHGDDGER